MSQYQKSQMPSGCPICGGVGRLAGGRRCKCLIERIIEYQLKDIDEEKRPLFQQASFAEFQTSRIAEIIEWSAKPTLGLFIFGLTGRGKSHLAVAIMRDQIEREARRTCFLATEDFFLAIRKCFDGSGSEAQVIGEYTRKGLLILDDLGGDRAAAESIFAMPYPLTISVLPNHEHSKEIADEALQRGFQVMLHLPMQSVANEAPEKEELRPGMSSTQVKSLLNEMIESVPNAVGVNNHQGSQATSDPALMNELMPALRGFNLFYVDSRTTAATVAFDTAQRDGVPTAFRNVPFLDDVQDAAAIRRQLQLAVRGAKEKKAAIAIGHPHAATLEALREFLPTVRASGVRLVFASDLVR